MFFKSKKVLAAGMLLSMMAFAAAGCGGVVGIGAGILAVVTVLGAAVIVRKKED